MFEEKNVSLNNSELDMICQESSRKTIDRLEYNNFSLVFIDKENFKQEKKIKGIIY